MSRENLYGTYKVEVFRDGEWTPARWKVGDKMQEKTVYIEHKNAEVLNLDSDVTKTRYVLEEQKTAKTAAKSTKAAEK